MPVAGPLPPSDYRNVQHLTTRLTRTSDLKLHFFPNHDSLPLTVPRKFALILDVPETPVTNDLPFPVVLSYYSLVNKFPVANGATFSIRSTSFPPGTFPAHTEPKHYTLTLAKSITFQIRLANSSMARPLDYFIVPDHTNPTLSFTNISGIEATVYTMDHIKSISLPINPAALPLE